jgi:uncharacterized protein
MPILDRLGHRLKTSLTTIPTWRDWQYVLILLGLFALIYLPIGFTTGFLHFDWRLNPGLILSVAMGALLMPGITEELIFRVLLLPQPTEEMPALQRSAWIGLSWLLFLLYHIPPWTPNFFKTPAFVIGAGLLGLICTVSYLQSRSIWTAVFIHWMIVSVWLLGLGGLARFDGNNTP